MSATAKGWTKASSRRAGVAPKARLCCSAKLHATTMARKVHALHMVKSKSVSGEGKDT